MLLSCAPQYAPNLILQHGYAYDYDFLGNRITANGDEYTTSTNNELTSDGAYTYTYDDEGNRISKTNSTNRELYTWDYRNRLTSVTQQTYNAETETWTTVQIVEYTYDYNNVWIRKIIGNDKTIFIPENYQTTVQIDNGAISHHYLWTPNAQDKLLADTTSSEILWSLTDHLGTIRDIIGDTNATHLIYDAFGNLISGTNPILFGYTGKAFDVSTSLQNNINRWYDSTVGRWLSTDPIGFEGNDTNLYRYVGNNSAGYLDVMGLQSDKPCQIHFFIGHGWPQNLFLDINSNVKNSFGDFIGRFNTSSTEIFETGIYCGMTGCWSMQNNYTGWKYNENEGAYFSAIFNEKKYLPQNRSAIPPIPSYMQIPNLPVQNRPMFLEQLPNIIGDVLRSIGNFAMQLCEQRRCSRPGEPLQLTRCQSIDVTFVIDYPSAQMLKHGKGNGKLYKKPLQTISFHLDCNDMENFHLIINSSFQSGISGMKISR